MWRALLRVSLLHLDATRNPSSTKLGPHLETTPGSAPRTVPRFGAIGVSGRPEQRQGTRGPTTAAEGDARRRGKESRDGVSTEGVGGVTVEVAMETCGSLLPMWGYG